MDESSQRTTIHLNGGPIIALSDDTFIRARGIKYATAARFHKPRALTTWDEAQDCTGPASICPQNPSRLGLVNGDLEKGKEQDENCLHVSVVAPKSVQGAPVMVFLHGGAWVSGGGDLDAYSPHKLAGKGIVGVTVTHRLGIFGYVPIDNVAPANLGLLDQIEALRWIRRNISSFGGDPRNVTLFGQSAGADAIFCLSVADDAAGLFHKGILQSPPTAMREDENREEMTLAMSQRAQSSVTPENASTLSLSSLLNLQKELLGVARSVSPALLAYGPIMGEYPLPPADKVWERFVSTSKRCPLLFGWTSHEHTAFTQLYTKEDADDYLHNLFKGSTVQLAQKLAAEIGKLPPTYEVAWYPEGSEELKAAHCIDLPLILGDWSAWKDAPMLQGPGVEATLEKLGDSVRNMWVAFAKGEELGSGRYIIDKVFVFPS